MWLDFWMAYYDRHGTKEGINIEAEDDEFDTDTVMARIAELNARRGIAAEAAEPDNVPPDDSDDWETVIDYQNPDQR